jgi:hypothetical protein
VPSSKWAGRARSPLPVRLGFGPIWLPVRVTQENDPEKICKQHFVVLNGFNPTFLHQNDHKATRRRETPADAGPGSDGRAALNGGSAKGWPPAAALSSRNRASKRPAQAGPGGGHRPRPRPARTGRGDRIRARGGLVHALQAVRSKKLGRTGGHHASLPAPARPLRPRPRRARPVTPLVLPPGAVLLYNRPELVVYQLPR